MNLVSNAIKFTHQGNVNVIVTPKINPSDTNRPLICICVEDEGIGMDAETQKKIFEPFIQADTSTTREYGGTGLGLAISRHYIEKMGGIITVHSKLGAGTKITVSIPLEIDQNCTHNDCKFSEWTARIISANPATYRMASSHLSRLGISSSLVYAEELDRFSSWDNCILIVDYNSDQVLREDITRLDSLGVKFRVILTPLNGSVSEIFQSNWIAISKPITSKALREVVCSKLLGDQFSALEKQTLVKASPPCNANSAIPPRALRILVAEDVGTNQQIIAEMVGILGHIVDIAENGKIAIEKYLSASYSLVFMDCQMPIMDGYSATREIRVIESQRKGFPVPIIALTAGSDSYDRERCLQAGMDGYITKPFSLSDIQQCLETHVRSEVLDSGDTELFWNESSQSSRYSIEIGRESKILNFSAIHNIREVERQTGKLLLPSIYEGYMFQMDEKIRDIEEAIISQDCISIFRSAHAIKSMSANIGAEKVQLISFEIEKRGRQNELTGMTEVAAILKKAYLEFISEFEIELSD